MGIAESILMFHYCEGQSQKAVSTEHNFWREWRAEVDSNRGPSAYQPNALPLGRTGSLAHFLQNSWRNQRYRGPSAYQPNALPLGQTGSQAHLLQNKCNTRDNTAVV